MDRHIQTLLNRLSCASITIATITLIYLLSQTPETCLSDTNPTDSQIRFPKSSCDSTHRERVSIEKKNKRIWSTNDWRKKLKSFTHFFTEVQKLGFLHNQSKVLCVSAGAGHEVMALSEMGVIDVTGVELVDSPPLVPVQLMLMEEARDDKIGAAEISPKYIPAASVVCIGRSRK